LLSAKLQVPAINKNIISRERVLQKLQKALECKLTLITAPAGYGKTTAILHWLEKCGLPVAWLSLDSHDNSPGVFWPYFCSALDNIVAGISQGTKYVFSDLEMMKANLHINILIDKLAEVESDFILVLDDLHYIADPAIMEGLSYLIDYLPPKMHLIFISRSTPEIGLARHKFKWQIQHIKEKDLRFGENEIFLFYQARGIILKNSEIRTLKSYTGGWAAALVAVAMSVEDDGGHCDVIADLKVSLKDIGQYLNDEVLRIWSDEKRNFAMKTCLLDTLSAGICDAITGENNGQRLLEEIYEANGFMVALDGPRREFRYHHLFKSFLQERLWKTSPDEIPRLHKRAGLWFREQGMIPEAIEHLLEGNSYPEAIDLI
jgi:LuxR family maltose regulon positive regulatory protein